MSFSEFDARMMARALRLAERGVFLTRPNPRVGCVITRDSEIVGEGYHHIFGEAHAEINALKCISDATGTTAYVTLEPCAHQGKTGPCAQALIDAKVARVVCAMRDPNPKVNGGGFALLARAGIAVESGLMEEAAQHLNRGFIRRMTLGLPFVTLKMAASVDGRTAMASGESQWITGSDARQDVQYLRAMHDAIITGRGTLEKDNPSLNVRFSTWANPPSLEQQSAFVQPLRILIDRSAQADLRNTFFDIATPIWWVGQQAFDGELPAHILRQRIPTGEHLLAELLKRCADYQCNQVLVEAGSSLAGEFIRAGLVDELVLYIAPKLMGSVARPLFDLPIDTMAQTLPIALADQRLVGTDLRLTYSFQQR